MAGRPTLAALERRFAGTWSAGRPVFDRTGLPARWDVQLPFVETSVAEPNADSTPVPNPSADSGPNMLSALRSQFGVKLQGSNARIEYLVIDQITRPANVQR